MKLNYIFLLTILLAMYTLGCAGGGGGANIKDVAKMTVPYCVGLIYVNVEKIREDEDLRPLLDDIRQDYEGPYSYHEYRYFCSFDEVSWIAVGCGDIISGNIDMNNVREYLEKGYKRSSYNDVEFWEGRTLGSVGEGVAILGDKIIYGSKRDVKKTLDIINGEGRSMYEGIAKGIIDRLPDGFAFRIETGMRPSGISVNKETSDTLKITGCVMCLDDKEAEMYKTYLRRALEMNGDAFNVDVERDGKFLVFNENFRVEDYKLGLDLFEQWG